MKYYEIFINPAYLHGDLQNEAGFDICYNLRGQNYPVKLEGDSGEMEIDVHLNKGEYKIVPGILVWWISKEKKSFKGLIVSPEDEISLQYAKKKQAEFPNFI